MSNIVILALSFQCMMESLQQASKVHINPKWKFTQSKAAPYRDQMLLLQSAWDDENTDPRLLALAWMESRIRPSVNKGDNGKACGVYQIHARYSYPAFTRGHWNEWNPAEHTAEIQKECVKLRQPAYSVSVMKRYLSIFDDNDLHPCHHQSGVKGTCNKWYKQRLDYWITYFQYKITTCSKGQTQMAMTRTGSPAVATPVEMVQGYLDGMQGKSPASTSEVYKAGYDLALSVKAGKSEAPAWALTAQNG